MGLYANRPIAVAPYMGENAFVAFGLAAIGATWPQMLGAVFVSGLVFLVITLLGVRAWLADAISTSLKHSFGVGHRPLPRPDRPLRDRDRDQRGRGPAAGRAAGPDAACCARPTCRSRSADLHDPRVLLALFGFVLIAVLLQRKVRGAILIGIVATALLGTLLGHGEAPRGDRGPALHGRAEPLAAAPEAGRRRRAAPRLPAGAADARADGPPRHARHARGPRLGGGLLDEKGHFPAIEKPMTVDAVSCVFAGMVGTTTSGAYIESATGIREGARTGLAAVTTAALFLGALFFVPLVTPLQRLQYAYAPALVAVGLLMISSARGIDFDDMTELVPAFATIAIMVFTYNIANGLTAGLALYPFVKTAAGRIREVQAGAWVLAALCLTYYLFGMPH